MTNLKQPTLDNTSTDPLTRLLLNTRSVLINSGNYLGDPAKPFFDHAVWRRVDRENRLVTKESADAVDKAQKIHAQSSSKDTSHPEFDDNDLEPLVLSTIVLVDRDDCWLQPDGNWKSSNAAKFDELKLTFVGKKCPPIHLQGQLADDFARSLENAKLLLNEVSVGDVPKSNFLVKAKDKTDALKFRHVVFEVISFTITYICILIFSSSEIIEQYRIRY